MTAQNHRPHAAVRSQARVASALLGVPLCLWAAASACAPVQPNARPAKTNGKVASQAMHADPATLAQLASFLRDYHHAVSADDRAFLTEHTTFPLPFAEGVYDMEAKARSGKIATVDELLKVKETLLWPEVLLPKDAADFGHLKRGAQKCKDKSPATPDWSQGEPAFALNADAATLTYLSNPCESETHIVTLHFARTGQPQVWRLRERTVRMGAK